MSAHVSSAVGGCAVPLHPVVVSPAAWQSSQYLNGPGGSAATPTQASSPFVPVAVALGAIGVAATTALGIDAYRRHKSPDASAVSALQRPCYRDAVEAIISGR